jgi:hypothetical protein
MYLLDRVWGKSFQKPHLLSLLPVEVMPMQLGVLHGFNILDDLQFLSQILVKPNLYLVSASHVPPICFLEDENILPDDMVNFASPSHLHGGLDLGSLDRQEVETPSDDQAFELLLDLLGRDVLFELHLALHGQQHQLLLAVSLHVASQDPLDAVDGIRLLLGLSDLESPIKHFDDLASADPHLSAPVDGGEVEETLHHELPRGDGLVKVVSENVLAIGLLDHLRCLHLEIFSLLRFESYNRSLDLALEIFCPFFLHLCVDLTYVPLDFEKAKFLDDQFVMSSHQDVTTLQHFAEFVIFCTLLKCLSKFNLPLSIWLPKARV